MKTSKSTEPQGTRSPTRSRTDHAQRGLIAELQSPFNLVRYVAMCRLLVAATNMSPTSADIKAVSETLRRQGTVEPCLLQFLECVIALCDLHIRARPSQGITPLSPLTWRRCDDELRAANLEATARACLRHLDSTRRINEPRLQSLDRLIASPTAYSYPEAFHQIG